MWKRLKSKLRGLRQNFFFLKAFVGPFKLPKVKFYFGKIEVGTPYFLPRKWVKFSHKDCVAKAEKYKEKCRAHSVIMRVDWSKPEYYKNHMKPVPVKWLWLDVLGLGWKTKWSSIDYRFETAPLISLVIFGKQLCIYVKAPDELHYWEAFLFYYLSAKGKNRKEKLEYCITQFPNTWICYKNGEEVKTNYYFSILKKKYHHLIPKV